MNELIDLKRRVQYLESETVGEKLVTRNILQKTQYNTDELAAMRVDITTFRLVIERMGSDVALITAAQVTQGTALDQLRAEVGGLRTEVTGVRTEVGDLRTEVTGIGAQVGGLRTEVTGVRTEVGDLRTEVTGIGAQVGGLRTEVTGVRTEVTGVRTEVTGVRTEVAEVHTRLDRLEATIDSRFDAVMAAIRGAGPHAAPAT